MAIFCCPVDGGLTYRPPNAKIYGPGNFGGSGVQPRSKPNGYRTVGTFRTAFTFSELAGLDVTTRSTQFS
ncbi:hypothetical protein COD27_24865 [Escherichia coli]|nr:hypothetical protein COD27_24865 [Escherichia coli]